MIWPSSWMLHIATNQWEGKKTRSTHQPSNRNQRWKIPIVVTCGKGISDRQFALEWQCARRSFRIHIQLRSSLSTRNYQSAVSQSRKQTKSTNGIRGNGPKGIGKSHWSIGVAISTLSHSSQIAKKWTIVPPLVEAICSWCAFSFEPRVLLVTRNTAKDVILFRSLLHSIDVSSLEWGNSGSFYLTKSTSFCQVQRHPRKRCFGPWFSVQLHQTGHERKAHHVCHFRIGRQSHGYHEKARRVSGLPPHMWGTDYEGS